MAYSSCTQLSLLDLYFSAEFLQIMQYTNEYMQYTYASQCTFHSVLLWTRSKLPLAPVMFLVFLAGSSMVDIRGKKILLKFLQLIVRVCFDRWQRG